MGPFKKYFADRSSISVFIRPFDGSPEGGGVLGNIRGNAGRICTPSALVASSKLLPVLIEVIGVNSLSSCWCDEGVDR